jgi:small redox-active disulfide protein 2
MGEKRVSRISVGGNPIGMVGLEEIFSKARDRQGGGEVELEKFLLEEAKKKNFIPARAEGEFAKALLTEFKGFLGEKVEEDSSVLQVRVLGMGCVNCRKLEEEVIAILAELNLAADFDHVQDIKEIARYGVMGTPALVINGEVKSIGRVPAKKQITEWLKDAQGKRRKEP